MKISTIAKMLLIPFVTSGKGTRRKVHKKRSLLIEREIEEVVKCISHNVEITTAMLCNGHADCPDQSDEFSCGKSINIFVMWIIRKESTKIFDAAN